MAKVRVVLSREFPQEEVQAAIAMGGCTNLEYHGYDGGAVWTCDVPGDPQDALGKMAGTEVAKAIVSKGVV